MAHEVMHIEASRSIWNGSAKTLCGITIPKPHTIWFAWLSSNPTCSTCEARNKAR
ncbi:hypothetical protein [Lentzea flaviverrucosa]|uniref:Uncharacterized protein n=1 Tax=Lentzea flaviverrucosa TaxID=200379 RepID=A0A1H9XK96_9PSEU|nr:hypothetical protein [Lentzea flaviverrucosa]RDI20328.1 hypothetical protein DFR72_115171 [Lentzea flaviverrucosa]SES46606.1 hypothetical protein SAMN05216195_115171 [Lentzea flaviverrucosa]